MMGKLTAGDTNPRQPGSREPLAIGLAAASLGLGAGLLAAPGPIARLAGIEEDDTTRAWQRAVGARELLACAAIAAAGPRPAAAIWFRAAGDAKDLALLALAARFKRRDGRRLAIATAVIAGIGALDVYAAIRLSRTPSPEPADDLSEDLAYEPPEPFKAIKGG
jgi:hypothetical protein